MRPWQHLVLTFVFLCGLAVSVGAVSGPDSGAADKLYRVVDGRVDPRTYNGYRRYHAGCNHCHGSDGVGSTFAPSLIDQLPALAEFRQTVLNGRRDGAAVMKGFGADPNVEPYVDDIYAYLQARADGALGRGRPERLE
jgi:mono/diheme cytochrome c family protein